VSDGKDEVRAYAASLRDRAARLNDDLAVVASNLGVPVVNHAIASQMLEAASGAFRDLRGAVVEALRTEGHAELATRYCEALERWEAAGETIDKVEIFDRRWELLHLILVKHPDEPEPEDAESVRNLGKELDKELDTMARALNRTVFDHLITPRNLMGIARGNLDAASVAFRDSLSGVVDTLQTGRYADLGDVYRDAFERWESARTTLGIAQHSELHLVMADAVSDADDELLPTPAVAGASDWLALSGLKRALRCFGKGLDK